MTTINPYLLFNGNTGKAFNFYKSVFGGEFTFLQRLKDVPEADKVPENEQDKIMHVSWSLDKVNFLMGSDTSETMGRKVNTVNNFAISVSTESEDKTTRIFNGLSAGGKLIMPLTKTFWNAFYGMIVDRFGIS